MCDLAVGIDVMDFCGAVLQDFVALGRRCVDERDEVLVVGYDIVEFGRDILTAHVLLHVLDQRCPTANRFCRPDGPPFDVVRNEAGKSVGRSVVECRKYLSIRRCVGMISHIFSSEIAFVIPAILGGFPGRRATASLTSGMVAFGFFAAGVDVLARISPVLDRRTLRGALAVFEEGGEMIALSVIAWFLVMVRRDFVALSRRMPRRS